MNKIGYRRQGAQVAGSVPPLNSYGNAMVRVAASRYPSHTVLIFHIPYYGTKGHWDPAGHGFPLQRMRMNSRSRGSGTFTTTLYLLFIFFASSAVADIVEVEQGQCDETCSVPHQCPMVWFNRLFSATRRRCTYFA